MSRLMNVSIKVSDTAARIAYVAVKRHEDETEEFPETPEVYPATVTDLRDLINQAEAAISKLER